MLLVNYREGDSAVRGASATGGDTQVHIGAVWAEGTAGSGGAATESSEFQHSLLRQAIGLGPPCGYRLLQLSEGTCF